MSRPQYAAIDAETHKIGNRPEYPPRAVGYSVQHGGKKKYLAFGHPTKNNCSRQDAKRYIKAVLQDHIPVFHHADFDLEVLEQDGIKVRGEYHDTMRLAFLNEPRSFDLGLKPQAQEWLDMKPEERDMLKAWIQENVPAAKRRKTKWGEYIADAPGSLVGTYAKGDTSRTMGLFRLWDREVLRGGMRDAYEREMALVPIKLAMEQQGIKVRLHKLKRELPAYIRVRDRLEASIRRRLGVKDINIGSSPQLAKALIANDMLSEIVRTPKGNVSTKRAILEKNCTDAKLVKMLAMHGTLETYIGTFLTRWVDNAEIGDGYIFPSFNTVRSTDEYGGGKTIGTRTGRLSSSNPNFQNVPANVDGSPHWRILLELQKLLRREGVDFIGLRDYFAPDEGCVFLRRDYSQQELRILAHFEEGEFLAMYHKDPTIDAHDAVKYLVDRDTGMNFPRKHIKQTNFGIIYGMGIAKLADRLEIDKASAKLLKKSVMKAVPGIRKVQGVLKALAKEDQPFHTWGNREYYCEEPRVVELNDGGKMKMSFEYKMLNTLIQGSAADCTKQGMINVDQNMQHGRVVLQVHDELVASVPREHAKTEMIRMREAMEDVKFKLPMLSDGDVGRVSWGRMKKVKDNRGKK